MAIQEFTLENMKTTIETNEMVFIDFWAPWCGPCQRFGPVFEAVAAKHPDIAWGKINTDDQTELAAQFGVMSIPTVGIFKDKELIFLQPGALPEEVLEEVVGKVRAVNMEEVRAQAANGELDGEDQSEEA
jgi:thioredoxin